MKTLNLLVFTVLLLIATTTVSAQQWCSQQLNIPPSHDVRKSENYGKEFSLYFFDHTKTIGGENMYFTNIFKVTFKFYGESKKLPIPFTDHIFESFNKYLEENVEEDWSLMRSSRTYGWSSRMKSCMSYEDIKERLAFEKENAKKRGWNVKVMEQFIPKNMELKGGPRDAPVQNISFNVVK